ncbi:hypothetical protein FOA22_22405 [Heyndrickxia oleronia]|uniref:BC1872 family protein n=1 Tax=Heyndrickxia oleronia TaxID=38875 RepID=UPI00333781EE
MDKREIDKLVAENVMGWKTRKRYEINKRIYEYAFQNINHSDHIIWFDLPEFSANIKDAWLVVEKLDFDVKVTKYENSAGYQCHVFIPSNVQMVFAETAPMAICKAALKAVGVEV